VTPSRHALGRAGGAVVALVLGACSGADGAPVCARSATVVEPGLRVRDLSCGTGPAADRGDTVSISYDAVVEQPSAGDGRIGEEVTFRLGAGQVIRGLDKGVEGMAPGGVRRLVVAPDLAFGSSAVSPDLPPDAELVFRVTLTSARPPPSSGPAQ
jgi:FKBP-type peptidyl-prolyl cis-trans isomerase FkpA